MGNLIGLAGKTFGRWTVIERADNVGRIVMWLCRCSCGTVKTVAGSGLKNGKTVSCGCYQKEVAASRATHNSSDSSLYKSWHGAKSRCSLKTHSSYHNYGGRGIKFCEEWHDFSVFKEWALSNGYKKGLDLDRIDNEGHYSPDNCRYVTRGQNLRNTRRNVNSKTSVATIRMLLNCGVKQATLARMFGCHPNTIAGIKNKHMWKEIEPMNKVVRYHA